MGTDKAWGRPHVARPIKSDGDRRRRQKTQQKRLAAMGVPAETIRTMDSRKVRTLLRKPEETRKLIAAGRI
jgi:hypothetical protein